MLEWTPYVDCVCLMLEFSYILSVFFCFKAEWFYIKIDNILHYAFVFHVKKNFQPIFPFKAEGFDAIT